MSTVSTARSLPRAATTHSRARIGAAILVVAMVATTALGLLVNLFFPEGDGSHLTYDTIEPMRTFFRAWLTLAAVNLVIGLTAFALAGWLLVPARGWIAATIGACFMLAGGALYAAGVAGVASLYYFGTDPAALDSSTSVTFLEHLDDHMLAVWGPAFGGAVMNVVGQLALALGLWRAASVPRWVPILAATIGITFLLPTSGVIGLFVELPSAIAGLGLAWCVWQRFGKSEAAVGEARAPRKQTMAETRSQKAR